jgi:hypothetical protein
MKKSIIFGVFVLILISGCTQKVEKEYDYCVTDSDCKVVGYDCNLHGVNLDNFEEYDARSWGNPCPKNSGYLASDTWLAFCDQNKCKVKFDCTDCNFINESYEKYCINPGTFSKNYCQELNNCKC